MASRRRLGGGGRRIAGARTYGVLRWATGEDASVGALVGLGDGLEIETLAARLAELSQRVVKTIEPACIKAA